MRRSKKLLRTLSFVLLQTFIAQQFSYADVLTPLVAKHELHSKPEVGLQFPDSVASIEDAYKNGGDKLFYLIQDAHTNESGQYNLSKALDTILSKETDLKYVFTEAGFGDDSLSFLKPYRTPIDRDRVAKSYIKKGLLHGHEYLNLMSDRDFTIWGVENPDLYAQSVENYRQVAKERERFDLYLKKIESTTETLKNRLFNPSLQTFDNERKAYREEKLALTSYFMALWREANLQNISLEAYPHLSLLKSLKEKEEKLDFAKANSEHLKAVEGLSKEDQSELKELTNAGQNKADKVLQGQKETQAYFVVLEEKMEDGRGKMEAGDYVELFKYFEYLKLAKGVEAKEVLKEIASLEDTVLKALTRDDNEKTLLRCEKVLFHLKKLFHFTLTPEEFSIYKEETQDFTIEHLTGFLNKQIMDLETYYDRSLFLEKGFDETLKRAEGFYELTKTRDEYFVRTALEKMDKESVKKAVLVTGGFHTTSLKSLLKEKGISFVSVTPQVWQATNMKKYESILLSQSVKPFSLPVSIKASTNMTLMMRNAAEAGAQGSRLALADIGGNADAVKAYLSTLGYGSASANPEPASLGERAQGARLAGTERIVQQSRKLFFDKDENADGFIEIFDSAKKSVGVFRISDYANEATHAAKLEKLEAAIRQVLGSANQSFSGQWDVTEDNATGKVPFFKVYLSGSADIDVDGARLATADRDAMEDVVRDFFQNSPDGEAVFSINPSIQRKDVVKRSNYNSAEEATKAFMRSLDRHVSARYVYGIDATGQFPKLSVKIDKSGARLATKKEVIAEATKYYETWFVFAQFEFNGQQVKSLEALIEKLSGNSYTIETSRATNMPSTTMTFNVIPAGARLAIASSAGAAALAVAGIGAMFMFINPWIGVSLWMLSAAFLIIAKFGGVHQFFDLEYDTPLTPVIALLFGGVLMFVVNVAEVQSPQPAQKEIEQPIIKEPSKNSGARMAEEATIKVSALRVAAKNETPWSSVTITLNGVPTSLEAIDTIKRAALSPDGKKIEVVRFGNDTFTTLLDRLTRFAEEQSRPLTDDDDLVVSYGVGARLAAKVGVSRNDYRRLLAYFGGHRREIYIDDYKEETDKWSKTLYVERYAVRFAGDDDKILEVEVPDGATYGGQMPIEHHEELNAFLAERAAGRKVTLKFVKKGEVHLVVQYSVLERIERALPRKLSSTEPNGSRLPNQAGWVQLTSSPDQSDRFAQLKTLVEKAKRAGVKKLTISRTDNRSMMSVDGRNMEQFSSLRLAELDIDDAIKKSLWPEGGSAQWSIVMDTLNIEPRNRVILNEAVGFPETTGARLATNVPTASRRGLLAFLAAAIIPGTADARGFDQTANGEGWRSSWVDLPEAEQDLTDVTALILHIPNFTRGMIAVLNFYDDRSPDESMRYVGVAQYNLSEATIPAARGGYTLTVPMSVFKDHEAALASQGYPTLNFRRIRRIAFLHGANINRGNNNNLVTVSRVEFQRSGARLAQVLTNLSGIKEKIKDFVNTKPKGEIRIGSIDYPGSKVVAASVALEYVEKLRLAGVAERFLWTETVNELLIEPTKFSILEQAVVFRTQLSQVPNPDKGGPYSIEEVTETLRAYLADNTGKPRVIEFNGKRYQTTTEFDQAVVRSGPEDREFLTLRVSDTKDTHDYIIVQSSGARLAGTVNQDDVNRAVTQLTSALSILNAMDQSNLILSDREKFVEMLNEQVAALNKPDARVEEINAVRTVLTNAVVHLNSEIVRIKENFNPYASSGGTRAVYILAAVGRTVTAINNARQELGRQAMLDEVISQARAFINKHSVERLGGIPTYKPFRITLKVGMPHLGGHSFRLRENYTPESLLSLLETSLRSYIKKHGSVDGFTITRFEGVGEPQMTLVPSAEGARLAATVGSNSIPDAKVRAWVIETAAYLGVDPDQLEIVDASDNDRLTQEEIEAGKLIALKNGGFYARSHKEDVARVVARTMIVTSNPKDKGIYNNWRSTASVRPQLDKKMKGAVKPGEKIYVIPHLMGPENSPLSKAVIQITNSRYVAINTIRMARVGAPAWNTIAKTGEFIKAVHYTGDLDKINRSGKEGEDDRYFALFPRTREIWSYGSAYGGNALLGKKFVALRQAGWDAVHDKKLVWMAEHMFILELEFTAGPLKGQKRFIAGGYPSASGKTNSAMITVPPALQHMVKARVLGDDIAWMYVNKLASPAEMAELASLLNAINPEAGFFSVAPGTSAEENPNLIAAMGELDDLSEAFLSNLAVVPGSNEGALPSIYTNVAFNEITREVWWERKSPKPTDLTGWYNWKGDKITDANVNEPWAQPNSRITVASENAPNISPSFNDPKGVPISVINYGGRVDDREPLLRVTHDWIAGVLDGISVVVRDLGIATQGGGTVGGVKPDFIAKDAFLSVNEIREILHQLKVGAELGDKAPRIAHVNFFQKDPETGAFMWPGFGLNMYIFILELMFDPNDTEKWTNTPAGYVPTPDAFYALGLSEQEVPRATLERLLAIDRALWLKEMDRREAYFKWIEEQLGEKMPEVIWAAHRKMRAGFEAMPASASEVKAKIEAYFAQAKGPRLAGATDPLLQIEYLTKQAVSDGTLSKEEAISVAQQLMTFGRIVSAQNIQARVNQVGARLAALASTVVGFENRVRELISSVGVGIEENFFIGVASANTAQVSQGARLALINKGRVEIAYLTLKGKALDVQYALTKFSLNIDDAQASSSATLNKISASRNQVEAQIAIYSDRLALSEVLAEVGTDQSVLLKLGTDVIGTSGQDKTLDSLFAQALDHTKHGDNNFRISVPTSIRGQVLQYASDTERDLKIKAGILTGLFDQTDFIPVKTIHYHTSESAEATSSDPEGVNTHFYVRKNADSGFVNFKLTVTTVMARGGRKVWIDPRVVSVFSTGIDPNVNVDTNTMSQVVDGTIQDPSVRGSYSFLPLLDAVNWKEIFRMTQNWIQSVGRAA